MKLAWMDRDLVGTASCSWILDFQLEDTRLRLLTVSLESWTLYGVYKASEQRAVTESFVDNVLYSAPSELRLKGTSCSV
jgi:hypothetical protein